MYDNDTIFSAYIYNIHTHTKYLRMKHVGQSPTIPYIAAEIACRTSSKSCQRKSATRPAKVGTFCENTENVEIFLG